MARVEIDPNYNSPTFSRATAATDIFKKEDIQSLAAAMSTHVHDGAGKGLLVGAAAAGSITNAQLGPDVARANLLTNGGFEQWSRGAGSFTANGGYTADRWFISGSSQTVGRATLVDTSSKYSAAIVVAASNPAQYYAQSIEDFVQLAGKTVTFSIRVLTSVANKIRAYYVDTVEAWGSYHTGDGTWQTLTVTRAVPVGAPSVLVGVQIDASAPGSYYLDNAMLVVGSQPANYVPLHPSDELLRCQRYYEVYGVMGTGEMMIGGIPAGAAGVNLRSQLLWKVQKAVTPTVTKVGTWAVVNCGQPVVGNSSLYGGYAFVTATAGGNADTYSNNGAAGAGFTIEGNP